MAVNFVTKKFIHCLMFCDLLVTGNGFKAADPFDHFCWFLSISRTPNSILTHKNLTTQSKNNLICEYSTCIRLYMTWTFSRSFACRFSMCSNIFKYGEILNSIHWVTNYTRRRYSEAKEIFLKHSSLRQLLFLFNFWFTD